jgi:hypothetical protein
MLRRPLNDALLLAVGTEQLVVRVDFDDGDRSGQASRAVLARG